MKWQKVDSPRNFGGNDIFDVLFIYIHILQMYLLIKKHRITYNSYFLPAHLKNKVGQKISIIY